MPRNQFFGKSQVDVFDVILIFVHYVAASYVLLSVQELKESSNPSSVAADSIWLQLIKQHVAAVRQNTDALKSVHKGDFCTAIQIWSVACNSPVHSPSSLFNLALCYEQGIGIEQNLDKVS